MIATIIQARMASTRLPGKVLMDINGKPMLLRVIERIKHSKLNQKIIIATSINREDDVIFDFALKHNIDIFRGSQDDVLNRYYETAKFFNVEVIVRITSDCPLIDPEIIDKVIHAYQSVNKTIVTNAGIDLSNRTYPRGLDVEVFSYNSLKNANNNAQKDYEREHVTPYLYRLANEVHFVCNSNDLSKYRLTVDTSEDLKLVREIYESFDNERIFYLREIMNLLYEKKHLFKINELIEQKSYLDVQLKPNKVESVLIVGSNGMLGSSIVSILKTEYIVYGLNRNRDSNLGTNYSFESDIKDYKAVKSILKKIMPNIIIFTAAIVDIDYCENNPDSCIETNYLSVVNWLKFISSETLFVFISTDSVFDDSILMPNESDTKNPLNNYSKSKSMSEDYITSNHSNHIIIRTNMYGFHKNWRGSLIEWAIDKFQNKISSGGFTDVIFNPLYTKQLARGIQQLIQIGFRGLIHLGSNASISKYSFLVQVAEALGYDSELVYKSKLESNKELSAIRPKQTSLNTDKAISISSGLNFKLNDGIEELINDLKVYWRIT
jgi:spore coat polysaccharide biosynthesis protein SpsF